MVKETVTTDVVESAPVETTEVVEEVNNEDTLDQLMNKLDITTLDVVTTNLKTMVVNEQGGVLGYLGKGVTVRNLGAEGDKYKIQYYDQVGYVTNTFVTAATILDINSVANKMLCATNDIELTVPDYLSNTGSEYTVTIPKNELLEVFEENDSMYIVRTTNLLGYINKENVQEIEGTFLVVDISDQEVKLYENNQVILDTNCVTGKESTPTHEGLWHVYSITHNRYLVGEGYKSWVDYMFSFNDGEGLHDAEYHSCNAMANHGWRAPEDFGGEKYMRSGSHGCVNMKHDAVAFLDDYVYMDMPVLVKK